jgi:hypothetical protein
MLNGRFGAERELLLWNRHSDLTTTSTDGQSTPCQKHVTFVSRGTKTMGREANCLESVIKLR